MLKPGQSGQALTSCRNTCCTAGLCKLAALVQPAAAPLQLSSALQLAVRSCRKGFPLAAQVRPNEIDIMRDADGKDIKLGEGGFGQVFKGRMNGVLDVAVKVRVCRCR